MGDEDHAVVWLNGIIHDPHPLRVGIKGLPDTFTFFMPLRIDFLMAQRYELPAVLPGLPTSAKRSVDCKPRTPSYCKNCNNRRQSDGIF
jgi:hypothetical protein